MTRAKPKPRYKISTEMAGDHIVLRNFHSPDLAWIFAQNIADLRRTEVSLHQITTRGEKLIAVLKPRGID